MKLRIRGNSVRFRLQQAEVRCLLERGHIEEHTRLGASPEQRLTYRVELSDEARTPSVSFCGSRISLTLPRPAARMWAEGDGLALEEAQPIGEGDILRILLEKDLSCLVHRLGEDDADAFPNPQGGG